MEPDREQILKALEQVIDPELKRNVVELDMVRDVRIEGAFVRCDADGRATSCEAVRVPV